MPSGLRKTSGNNFEIYYEQPWGGVASDKDPVDIAPNQLVVAKGAVALDNVLCQINFICGRGFFNISTPQAAGSAIVLVFELGGLIYGLDQFGSAYKLTIFLNGSAFVQIVVSTGPIVYLYASDGPWAADGSEPPSAVQVVNGTAYVSNFARHSIYSFSVDPATSIYSYTLQSDYAGGKVLGVLDDYLLQLNTNNVVDGVQPNRINWSGPGEFGTWDPSIDRTAGFNTLAAIEDELTGFLSFASVGIAISRKGLIQLSPTGVGIGPFSFTALWTSQVGQGSIYTDSVTQYGQFGFLTTNTGIYSVSASAGFTSIGGAAEKAILSSFQGYNSSSLNTAMETPFVAGGIMLYSLNSRYNNSYYILACIPANYTGQAGVVLTIWMYEIKSGIWHSSEYLVDDLVNAQNNRSDLANGIIQYLKVTSCDASPADQNSPLGAGIFYYNNTTTLITLVVKYGSTSYNAFLTPFIYNSANDDPEQIGTGQLVNQPTPLELQFREEEIKLGRQPTIRRVVLRAYGNGTLAFDVSGVDFGTIVLDGQTVPRTYKTPKGNYTGEDPQLTVTSTNYKGVITKLMLSGAYADGDID